MCDLHWRKTYRVDHRIKYMVALANIVTPILIQNMTSMVRTSHGPVLGIPYSQMVMSIVETLIDRSNTVVLGVVQKNRLTRRT